MIVYCNTYENKDSDYSIVANVVIYNEKEFHKSWGDCYIEKKVRDQYIKLFKSDYGVLGEEIGKMQMIIDRLK